MLKRRVTSTTILLLIVGTIVLASELVLRDGRVIEVEKISRDGENYVGTLVDGGKIVLPLGLVESVHLTERGERPAPQGPSGLRIGEPQNLAGTEVRPPTTREQLAVFGEPSRFQQNIIDPTWTPESDWDMDPANNNFAPSKWAKDIIDPTWEPVSALDAEEDVLENSRSSWQKSIIDPTWTPTDGFAK